MQKRNGFTLAEVLVTLMVIGVVAVLTIPSIINTVTEQQYKTAYKKAFSTINQAVRMLNAREIQCNVRHDEDLAKCFTNVMTGNQVDHEGKVSDSNAKNVLITNDGTAYSFSFMGKPAADATSTRTIGEMCGEGFSTEAGHEYEYGKCAVAVDLNGLSKGSKSFFQGINNPTADYSNMDISVYMAVIENNNKKSDQEVIIISGAGARPSYVNIPDEAFSSNPGLAGINNGYYYLFGKGASPYATSGDSPESNNTDCVSSWDEEDELNCSSGFVPTMIEPGKICCSPIIH